MQRNCKEMCLPLQCGRHDVVFNFQRMDPKHVALLPGQYVGGYSFNNITCEGRWAEAVQGRGWGRGSQGQYVGGDSLNIIGCEGRWTEAAGIKEEVGKIEEVTGGGDVLHNWLPHFQYLWPTAGPFPMPPLFWILSVRYCRQYQTGEPGGCGRGVEW